MPTANGADARPEEVERPHGDLEALVDLAEDMVGRHRRAVEDESPDRMRREQRERLTADPVARARDGRTP
jgi:hypothetical protein